MRALPRPVGVVALIVLAAGCLGDAKEQSPAAGTDVSAPPQTEPTFQTAREFLNVSLTGVYPANPDFNPDPMHAKNGSRIVVTFRNTDGNPLGKHDWALEGVEGARTEVIDVGQEATVEFDAPPSGRYVFYCSVPGHRDMGAAGGMQGELVIQ